MKIFDISLYNQIIVMILLMHGLLFARGDDPFTTLPAYQNQFLQIVYSVGSDNQHDITFICKYDPICIYTPLCYEDSDEQSLTQTYFLPRMRSADSHMRYFYDDMRNALKKIGIEVTMKEVQDIHYGLQMSFTMQTNYQYDIVQVVNSQKKTVSFRIIEKI